MAMAGNVNPEMEVYCRPDQLEDIISAAEEAAYSEIE